MNKHNKTEAHTWWDNVIAGFRRIVHKIKKTTVSAWAAIGKMARKVWGVITTPYHRAYNWTNSNPPMYAVRKHLHQIKLERVGSQVFGSLPGTDLPSRNILDEANPAYCEGFVSGYEFALTLVDDVTIAIIKTQDRMIRDAKRRLADMDKVETELGLAAAQAS